MHKKMRMTTPTKTAVRYGFAMRWRESLLLLFWLIGPVIAGRSQQLTMLSATSQDPLPRVKVLVLNLQTQEQKEYYTNKNGRVELDSLWKECPALVIGVWGNGMIPVSDTIGRNARVTYRLVALSDELDPVVVTAQHLPGSRSQAVHRVNIIGRKKIEAMAAMNLRDLLSNELNIRLSQDQILGSSMTLQGVGGQNIKLLIDGVPVIGRLDGNIDISQLNLHNAERIEIIEGPLSVNYGSDALGGTINIITQKTQQGKPVFSAQSYYESNGTYNNHARLGWGQKKTNISLNGGRYFFDGWRPDEQAFHLEKVRVADSFRFKEWKPREQYFYNFMLGHELGKLKLTFKRDAFLETVFNRGRPRGPHQTSAFDDNYITRRNNNSILLNGPVHRHWNVQSANAWSVFERQKNTYFNDLTLVSPELSHNQEDQDTSRFTALMSRSGFSYVNPKKKWQLELGYDLNHETAHGRRIRQQMKSLGDYALYATAEWSPKPGLALRPGLRVAHNTAYQAPLIPSFNLRYNFRKPAHGNNQAQLRFSYARGFRAPSLKELFFLFVDINHNIQGNERLDAERSHNLNASFRLSGFSSVKGSYLTELSVFYNYIDNMITLGQINGQQYTYLNIDRFQTLGGQLSQEWQYRRWKTQTGLALTGRYNPFSADANALPLFILTPEARANLQYEDEKQRYSAALFYKYTGRTPAFGVGADQQIIRQDIQTFHTADLSFGVRLFNSRNRLGIGIKNLFDVRAIDGIASGGAHSSGSTSIPVAMGRTCFIKLNISW